MQYRCWFIAPGVAGRRHDRCTCYLAAALATALLAAGCSQSGAQSPHDSLGPHDPLAASQQTPAGAAAEDLSRIAVELEEPTPSDPLSLGIALEPVSASQSANVQLVIRGRHAAGWHSYAVEGPTAGSIPTQLELVLPEGVELDGTWQLPQSHMFRGAADEDQAVYDGEINFGQRLRVTSAAAGDHEIRCRVTYQTCTAESCLPPKTVELATVLRVQ